MKVYFDENLPPAIARGLSILNKIDGVEVANIVDEFGRGSADEEWIPHVGDKRAVVVTQDHNIHRVRQQRELYRECKIGIFIIKPPSKKGYKYWELVQFIINRWEEIAQTASNSKRPFGFVLKPRSSKMIDLDDV